MISSGKTVINSPNQLILADFGLILLILADFG
jgi:hypothetical protein